MASLNVIQMGYIGPRPKIREKAREGRMAGLQAINTRPAGHTDDTAAVRAEAGRGAMDDA